MVVIGGALGTWLRAGLGHLLPRGPGEWPWATLAVNFVGAFVLAVLLELLARLRRGFVPLRLLLGTGLLGGFTTYSAFAVETVDLLRFGRPWLALGYAGATLAGGLLLSLAGLRLVSRPHTGPVGR